MTYEQSLKNIEVLKNHIMPFDCEYIYFDFCNYSDFKITFLNQDEAHKIENFIQTKFRAKLSFAYIRMTDSGQEVLYYEDILTRYEVNLTTLEVLKSDCKKILKKRCPAQLKLDMTRLLFKLKNMCFNESG